MAREIRKVSNIEIDEISLVDVPANQHASVVIAKRATEEEAVNEIEIYDESGNVLDESEVQFGDVVFDAEGQAFEVVPENEDDFPEDFDAFSAEEVTVGKSYSFADEIREELSKAHTDYQRDEIIAKALEAVEEADIRAYEAELIAKSEQDLRLNREYIEVAKSYNVPVDPEELGPVLKRLSENMSYEDCAVIAKALEASGDVIFDEIGYIGGADNVDVYQQVEAAIDSQLSKADGISKAAAVADFFDQNQDAYDAYLSGN
jgi:hypothetical protein